MVLGRRAHNRYDQSSRQTRITVIEKVLGSIGLLICGVLLLRMALAPQRRLAFDAALRNCGYRLRHAWRGLMHWRPSSRKQAARAAEEAIERARRARSTERDGNVYRPKSFKGPRKPH